MLASLLPPLMKRIGLLVVCAVMVSLISHTPLSGQSYRTSSKKKVVVPKKIKAKENRRLAWIVIDAATGEVILEYKSTEKRYPASITKVMTAYLVLEQIRKKTLKFTDQLRVSKNAASKCRLKLNLKEGSWILLKDALLGALVHSANDASAVLAEAISNTESEFSVLMTQKAKKLGLRKTQFRNATGLPNPSQVTCALDLAKLCQALIRDFPEYYHYFSVQKFTYRGTTYKNANKLLGTVSGVDGIKTGYTPMAGLHLAASARRGNTRLIAVVLGTRNANERTHKATAVLEEGFRIVETRARKISSKRKTTPKKPPPKPSDLTVQDLSDDLALETFLKEEVLPSKTTLDRSAELDEELALFLTPQKQHLAPPSQKACKRPTPPVKPSSPKGIKPLKPPPSKPALPDTNSPSLWAIQVGAFTQETLGHKHIQSLTKDFSGALKNVPSRVIGPVGKHGKKFFLSRFINLTQKEALRICKVLTQASKDCIVVAPPPQPESPSQKRPPPKPKNKKRKVS